MPNIGVLNDFTPNTTIVSADVEANFETIRTAFNSSAVLTDVAKTITVAHDWNAAQDMHAGSVSAPGIYLNGDTNSGIYQIAGDNWGVAMNAAKVLDISTTGLVVTGAFTATGNLVAASVTATGALQAASLTATGNLSVSGTAAIVGVSTLTGDVVAATIRRATSDGADNSSLVLTGGGAYSSTRGAFIDMYGNEGVGAGSLFLGAGNAAGGRITFDTGGATRGEITNAGVFAWTGNMTVGGTLAVTGSTALTGTLTTRNTAVETDSTYDIGSNAVRYLNIYGDNLHGTISTAAQPNITSVGTLTSLDVSGALSAGSLTFSGALTAASLNLGGATLLDILTATVAWDIPSTAAGSYQTTTVAVSGAAVGDIALCSSPHLADSSNNFLHAYVSAADTVTLVFKNDGAVTEDPTSRSVRVVVLKF